MKRAALGILFASSAGSLAGGLASPPAWILSAVGVASILWPRSGPPPAALAGPARRILRLALVVTFVFGWLVMVYPAIGPGALRFWSLVLGYCAGALGAFFLLAEPPERSASSSVPAAIAMLVVASFDFEARIHPYLYGAAISGFAYLWADLPRLPLGRGLSAAGSGLASAGFAAAIVLVLPWTQGKVEQTMLTLYVRPGEGMDARSHSRLGELQRLKLSKRVVLRVWSERPQRLRTGVLDRFDGTGWFEDGAAARELAPAADLAPLDARSRAFLASLPGNDFAGFEDLLERQRLIHTRVVRVDGDGLATPGGSLVLRAPLDRVRIGAAGEWLQPPGARVRLYGVLHEMDHRRAQRGRLPGEAREKYLQVPGGLDPRFAELASRLTAGTPSTEAAVEAVVSHLRESYRYSLDLGAIDPHDPLADFLFEKKRGWCEYFAGAAAVLLRTQGIPTRYVRGFNVIGSQRKSDHFVVRDWDRHAWIEAYIEGKGWLEYDPTPGAEYESLHANLDDGLLSRALEWVRARAATFYAHLRHFDWASLVPPLIGLAAVGCGALVAFRLWRGRGARGRRSDPKARRESTELAKLVAELDQRLAALGRPRPESRAPLEHWTGLDEGSLPRPLRELGARILERHYQARFGGRAVPPGEEALLGEALRRLPESLSGASSCREEARRGRSG